MITDVNHNDLGRFSTPRKWNDLAQMCYARGCVCEGCDFAKRLSDKSKCQTKASVLEMVRLFGKPFERENVISEVVMND